MNKQEISSLIRNACAELGVKLTIGRGKSVKVGNIRCSGFFDDEIPELAIATGRDEYLGTFIHEYNHMMQWKEQIPAWVALDACRGCQNFDLWMDGMEFDMPAVNKFIDRIIDIEMDCEKRTVDFIVQNGVDIDVSEYIKKANSYVLFYNHARETRKWYHRNRKPYEVFEVWSAMPDTFVENPYFLTDAQKTLYVQYT